MKRGKRRRAGNRINPDHTTIRTVLRVVGPALIGVAFFSFVGAASIWSEAPGFFEDTDAHQKASTRAMGYVVLGGFLTVAGIGLTAFAFQGAVARFQAAEMAPVATDTANYVVDGTRESVKTVAKAVAEGIREIGEDGGPAMVRCHKCNKDNDADAKFCDACGAALEKTVKCAACGELNDPDAKFCDNCGEKTS